MQNLYEKLESKMEFWRSEISSFVKANSEKKISEVNLSQVYGGLRGVKCLVCDTSEVPNDKGLIIRNHPLKEISHISPEEVFYLLLTGDLPNKDELQDLSERFKTRKNVPEYVWKALKNLPEDTHPMVMLSIAILTMQKESLFTQKYHEGVSKNDYWKYTLEDALNLIAKLPAIAAGIYRIRFNKGDLIPPDPNMDLSGDYVHMLGIPDPNGEFYQLIKLFLMSHSDHESGNVSAFSASTVNSALSDLYYSLSAGFNGLAGPLHGLANQEVLQWILETMEKYGGDPTKEQIIEHVHETLNAGKVIPGYGHAVLRVVDPRFEAFYDFGMKYCKEEPVFKVVRHIFEVVPDILRQISKIKDPWPNIDAISGSLLYHYGLREFPYYTVIFALSRALGLSAQAVMNRGLGLPIIRPKSVTTEYLKKVVSTEAVPQN